MKNATMYLILLFGIMICACSKDEDSGKSRLLDESEVSHLVSNLMVNGYTKGSIGDQLPESYTTTYSNPNLPMNIFFAVSRSIGGEAIKVNDFLITNLFTTENVDNIRVNGTDVYQALDVDTWRAIFFKGQYSFSFSVFGPTAETAKPEVDKFVQQATTLLE